MNLPEKITALLSGKTGIANNTGMSGSSVTVYDDVVLKIENNTPELQSSLTMMRWLQDKVPIPRIIHQETISGTSYLLMSRAKGAMACSSYYMERPALLSELLADGLNMLWSVDISDCPKTRTLADMLKEARYIVEHDMVDMSLVGEDTFGDNGFRNPAHLLEWLEANKPVEEFALVHGDYCLPNVFLDGDKVSCFIDLGDIAVSDRWRDIALCYRSMNHNFNGAYGGRVYHNPDPEMIFKKLNIKPDWDRIRYHLLLDELF